MKTDATHLNPYRNRTHPQFKTEDSDGMTGFFVIPLDPRNFALVIASPGNEEIPWEHVSARIGEKHNKKLRERIPTWDEMCQIKDLFWNEDEAVMQLHVPESEFIRIHPFVLHLWKPIHQEIPRPPQQAV